MLKGLKGLFTDSTKDWKQIVHDKVLGELKLNDDATGWNSYLEIEGRKINFQIGGEREPDVLLLTHAYEIVECYSSFVEKVRKCLERERKRQF